MKNKQLSPLGEYIQKQLRLKRTENGKPWSLRELARRSNIAASALSVIVRGKAVPETATLESIANALGVTFGDLLAAGGLHNQPLTVPLDQSAAYVARRLTELPPPYRDHAIELAGAVADQFHQLIGEPTQEKVARLERATLLDFTAEELVLLRDTLQHILDAKKGLDRAPKQDQKSDPKRAENVLLTLPTEQLEEAVKTLQELTQQRLQARPSPG